MYTTSNNDKTCLKINICYISSYIKQTKMGSDDCNHFHMCRYQNEMAWAAVMLMILAALQDAARSQSQTECSLEALHNCSFPQRKP